jgi:DNA-binding NtrC family response regulator
MPARIVVVHDDPAFVDEATAALRISGYDVAGFTDPMIALNALEAAEKVEVLVTRVRFAPGKPHGISLAMMARYKRQVISVLFVAPPEFADYVHDIGHLMLLPVGIPDLVETVGRLLEVPSLPSD